MRNQYVGSGLFLMLVCAYLDNVRGPLLPVLSRELGLPYGMSSWFFVAGNFASVFCTFLLIPLSRLYGDRALAASICALGTLSVVVATRIEGFPSLVVAASLWGSTVSLFGAISNVLILKGTDVSRRARFFCGLHMMYGFGSLAGPGIVGALLAAGWTWRAPLWWLAPVFLASTAWVLFTFPSGRDHGEMPPGAARLSPVQVKILLGFCAYVAGEVLISTWMTAYLTDVRKLPIATAASYLTGFFLTMGATRALCFLSLPPGLELFVLRASLVLSGALFALGHAGHLWAFPLSGVLGPFFPLYMARMSREYPAQSRALTLWVLTSVQLTLVLFQLFLGSFADRVGLATAYWLPLVMLGVTLAIFKR